MRRGENMAGGENWLLELEGAKRDFGKALQTTGLYKFMIFLLDKMAYGLERIARKRP